MEALVCDSAATLDFTDRGTRARQLITLFRPNLCKDSSLLHWTGFLLYVIPLETEWSLLEKPFLCNENKILKGRSKMLRLGHFGYRKVTLFYLPMNTGCLWAHSVSTRLGNTVRKSHFFSALSHDQPLDRRPQHCHPHMSTLHCSLCI